MSTIPRFWSPPDRRCTKGQQVAKAGRSGVASGVHCHFGIQYNGTYYNPLNYLS